MSTSARWAAGAALALLVVVGFVRQSSSTRQLTAGTHGTVPAGFGAFVDALDELGLEPSRGDATALPPGRTAWWVSSFGICRPRDAAPSRWEPLAWVRGGGTAVLLLPERRPHERCALGPDVRLPLQRDVRDAKPPYVLEGDLFPAARRLSLSAPAAFRSLRPPWRARGTLAGRPFVAERPLGAGRLVVVADGRFLQNAQLGRADAALAGVDLVRHFGAPTFDEAVTARHARGTVAYLARSPAAPLLLALAVLGVAACLHARMLPPQRLPADASADVRLDRFVDSLATLYARSGSPAEALAPYRTYARGMLRRHFGLPTNASTASIVDCAARHGAPAPVLALLHDGPVPAGTPEGAEGIRVLDAYLWKVTA